MRRLLLGACLIGLVAISSALLTSCNGRTSGISTTVIVDERSVSFAENPPIKAVWRAVHDASADAVYQYGTFFKMCGDLDGDGHTEVAAMYRSLADLDACMVDVISFAGQKVLKSIRVDECDFEEGGALVADVDGDGKCELVIVTPDSIQASYGRMIMGMTISTIRQHLQVYSLDSGELILRHKLRDVNPRNYDIRIIGLIDDLDGDGKRECVVNYSLDQTVVLSLPECRTLYDIQSPPLRETQRMDAPRGITCGDLDSDRITDFVICYPTLGSCDVHSGVDGHRIRTLTVSSEYWDMALHYSADLLRPGCPGLLIGSRYEARGVVRIFDLQSGQKTMEWSCRDTYKLMGSSVATLRDLDGDDVPEILLSGEREPSSNKGEGIRVAVILLSQNHDVPIVLSGSDPTKWFGRALCPVGALGREGMDGFLVGEPGRNGTQGTGRFSGSIWLLECEKLKR